MMYRIKVDTLFPKLMSVFLPEVKGYIQVLVVGPDTILGTSGIMVITSVGRWSAFGEVIETIPQYK